MNQIIKKTKCNARKVDGEINTHKKRSHVELSAGLVRDDVPWFEGQCKKNTAAARAS